MDVQQQVINFLREKLREVGQAAVNAEKNNPLYGQLQSGVRSSIAPILQNISKSEARRYQSFSQPDQPGVLNTAARVVGQQVPYIPLVMATGAVANPVTSKVAQAIPAGRTVATNVLSGAAKGGIQTAPYGWMGGLNYAESGDKRGENIMRSTLISALLGGAAGGANSYITKALKDRTVKSSPVLRDAKGRYATEKVVPQLSRKEVLLRAERQRLGKGNKETVYIPDLMK